MRYFQRIKSNKKSMRLLIVFGVLTLISLWTAFGQQNWGLHASYYANADRSGEPEITRIDRNPYLKGNSRDNILSASVFSVKWLGWIAIQQTGTYKFATNSDDGSTLFLNKTLLVNNGGTHGLQRRSQEVELEKGLYPIEIHYLQVGGYSVLQVFWTQPGGKETFIPHEFLFAEKPSWFGMKYRRLISHASTVLKIAWCIFLLSLSGIFLMPSFRKYSSVTAIPVLIALIFFLFLYVFCIQTFWKVFPESPLYGITIDTTSPHLSLETWFSGNFQQAAEAWFNQHVGFRSFWVRTYNQINFSIFRQIPSASSGTSIVLGSGNWLYEKAYLLEYAGYLWKTTAEQVDEKIQTLLHLQESLARHNITFLFIISPSKASVYPEYMPRQYQTRSNERAYDIMTPVLDKYGIQYIDAYTFFEERKSAAPYQLFPKGGIHWNDYGAFLIFRESIVRLNRLRTNPLPIPEYDSITLAPPREPDNDLVKLLNIWTPQAIEDLCPYPHFTTTPIPPENQPNILIIGDSFAWHLADFFSEQQICTDIEVLFYNKHLVKYPHKTQQLFEKDNTDWNTLLLARDIVLIEINQAFLHDEIGFGFVNDALEVLENSPNAGEQYVSGKHSQ